MRNSTSTCKRGPIATRQSVLPKNYSNREKKKKKKKERAREREEEEEEDDEGEDERTKGHCFYHVDALSKHTYILYLPNKSETG